MKWFIKRYVMLESGKEYCPLGSSHQIFIHDLKTLRGVLNRIRRYSTKDIVRVEVYTYTDVFDKGTYKLVHTKTYPSNKGIVPSTHKN